MRARLKLDMLAQPDDFTCGPTCLHAIYRYYGDKIELAPVVHEVEALEGGGTLAVILACHALKRGYTATIYTYNLQVFDPTWLGREPTDGLDLAQRLQAQAEFKRRSKLQVATRWYLEFLRLGGRLRGEDLAPGLIRRYLKRRAPILTGLSATYLYGCAREYGPQDDYDDIRGEPSGHFVVLCGYSQKKRRVLVADPLHDNPAFTGHRYSIGIERVIGAILLGILTHDADIVIIEPGKGRPPHKTPAGHAGEGQGGRGGRGERRGRGGGGGKPWRS